MLFVSLTYATYIRRITHPQAYRHIDSRKIMKYQVVLTCKLLNDYANKFDYN